MEASTARADFRVLFSSSAPSASISCGGSSGECRTASESFRFPRPFAHYPYSPTHEHVNRPLGSGFVHVFVVPFSVIVTFAVAEPS